MLYGQELDDGTVEWLPGATVSLKEWSADDEEMSFSASDRFDGMKDGYNRQQEMRAVKGNKEYTIDETQKKGYQDSGFDILDDDGIFLISFYRSHFLYLLMHWLLRSWRSPRSSFRAGRGRQSCGSDTDNHPPSGCRFPE